MYEVLRKLVRLLFPLLVRVRVQGQENFPPSGPYILATNHLSVFDLPLLLMVCPHTVRAFAASKHRRNPFYALLLTAAGSIWVRRGEIDREALQGAFEVLRRGEVLGIAPEGTRARRVYALQPGKTGAAYIATRADVPIVPVGLTGTEKIKQNLPRLRRTDVVVNIGKPFRLPESGRVRGPKLDKYTDLIMRRIAALLPPDYRGVYRDVLEKEEF
ncbi:MAG: lysophospholipid acyltransferase family protein [Anaerolineae bacterium]|nr:1-acyl-sn-glycerol-3-phosphate acyltransferase [Anaerolineae bacterium]MCX8068799.1 1-acyl-sn-glycerol-3-phosphate acyltransferase [Anaerolineae bacterium]MDW7990741.1 lysophospholipid acyltransferase family protein [Anaerolineae bacterium]